MRDTESHPPSLLKFLKQPLVVCNGVRKKKNTERKQCIPETLQKTDRRQAGAATGGDPGEGFSDAITEPPPQTGRGRPGTRGAQTK